MDDSSMFLQWALSTLQHHDPGVLLPDDDVGEVQALREASQAASAVVLAPTEPTKSRSSGVDTGEIGCVWSMSPNSGATSAPAISILPTSWNFGAVSTRPSSNGGGGGRGMLDAVAATLPETTPGSAQPTRRGSAGTAYAQDHIMAERKRREKINQRFIELSALIPGLKKMDKGTILAHAVRHVKELQERVRSLEAAAGASTGTSIQTLVLVKKPCLVAPSDDKSSPAQSFSALPEIEVKFSDNNVMVRIHCEDGKGLVVRVLAEAEELHLRIVHNNVMPFTASTVIITIMAKVQEGFTINTEEIVRCLSCALDQHSSNSY